MAAAQYATKADMSLYGLPAAALVDVDDNIVERHLRLASGKVNSYLRSHNKLPLATPFPDEIVEATCVLAAYSLLNFRGYNADEHDDNFRRRVDDLIGVPGMKGWLTMLTEGKVNISRAKDATPNKQEGAPQIKKGTNRDWETNALGGDDTKFI